MNRTPNASDIASPGLQPNEIELGVAPRVSQADVDAAIVSATYHVFPGTMLTVCCATMRNGYTVTGESACASPENFRQDIGERLAYADAKRKVWPLLGYALRERLALDPMRLAKRFHEAYERLAPSFGYVTRPNTRAFDPESSNGRLMLAVCAELCAPAVRPVAIEAPAAPGSRGPVRIAPTVGRVVWYFRQGMAPAPFSQPWDAHICRVNEDGTINVGGFDDEGAPYFVLHVPLIQEGEPTPTGVPWCEWMPYQQGQARK